MGVERQLARRTCMSKTLVCWLLRRSERVASSEVAQTGRCGRKSRGPWFRASELACDDSASTLGVMPRGAWSVAFRRRAYVQARLEVVCVQVGHLIEESLGPRRQDRRRKDQELSLTRIRIPRTKRRCAPHCFGLTVTRSSGRAAVPERYSGIAGTASTPIQRSTRLAPQR